MSKSVIGPRSQLPRKKNDSIGLWIVGISAAVVLIVVLVVALSNRPTAVTVEAPDVPAEWINRNILGNPEAPVTVTAWEDFLCPACRQWTTAIEPKLIEDFVKDGKVKIEFRQFPLQGHAPGSDMAATASLCAADQNAFWTYHSRLFAAQDRGQPAYEFDALVTYASELGLDSRTFTQCLSSQKYRPEVQASFSEAVALNLTGTPSIFINGKAPANWADYEEQKAMIEAELAAAGQ
jgi:protein-disulfide isomerase